jgi:phospholipid/cholesterol/gamma-HCH transport system substrate-binding protein
VGYVGLGDQIPGSTYIVNGIAAGGGLFANAPVTFRGVPVGRVASVDLHGDGVRARLRLDRDVRVPADLSAVVAQRSAVGEQYLDLRPASDAGPYLTDGATIPRERTGTPLPMENLLSGLDTLVTSVGVEDLSIVIEEMGKAFEGNEAALRRLLDANSALLLETDRHLPEILALIRDGRTVLTTQLDSAGAIRRWAASLAVLSAAMRASDPDLRRLLAEGPPAAAETTRLLRDLEPEVGILLGNRETMTSWQATRRHRADPGVPSPSRAASRRPRRHAIGLVLNANDPAAQLLPRDTPVHGSRTRWRKQRASSRMRSAPVATPRFRWHRRLYASAIRLDTTHTGSSSGRKGSRCSSAGRAASTSSRATSPGSNSCSPECRHENGVHADLP